MGEKDEKKKTIIQRTELRGRGRGKTNMFVGRTCFRYTCFGLVIRARRKTLESYNVLYARIIKILSRVHKYLGGVGVLSVARTRCSRGCSSTCHYRLLARARRALTRVIPRAFLPTRFRL